MTISNYKEKIKRYDESIKNAWLLIGGTPKPGVDYGEVLARSSEITVESNYIDESIFKLSPLVSMLLIDMREDERGLLTRLTITRQQRQQLIDNINSTFGESLTDESTKTWTVSAALVLKSMLESENYKCSDEGA